MNIPHIHIPLRETSDEDVTEIIVTQPDGRIVVFTPQNDSVSEEAPQPTQTDTEASREKGT